MNQRNTNGILGLFVGLVIMVGVFMLFIRVVSFFFPLIAIIIVVVIFWRIIKNFIPIKRTKTTMNEGTTERERQQQAKKNKSKKEPIDVEYTVIDDKPADKQKKNDR